MGTFLFGAIGALAPEIIRLYDARLQPFRVPRHYWLVSLAYLLLGGVVALLLSDPGNPFSAFYVGVALPVTIGALARQAKIGKTGGTPAALDQEPPVEEVDPQDLPNYQLPFQNFLTLV